MRAEQRRRRLWTKLEAAASAAVAAAKPDESVTWLNQVFRAIWNLYEQPLAKYVVSKLQPKMDANRPPNIRKIQIKSFSFGAVEARRSDGRYRLAPIIMERVRMVNKSFDATNQRVRYVFQADVRWHTGSVPLLVLEIHLGHRLLLMSVDAEASDLTLAGTLQIELDFIRPYPWLGEAARTRRPWLAPPPPSRADIASHHRTTDAATGAPTMHAASAQETSRFRSWRRRPSTLACRSATRPI